MVLRGVGNRFLLGQAEKTRAEKMKSLTLCLPVLLAAGTGGKLTEEHTSTGISRITENLLFAVLQSSFKKIFEPIQSTTVLKAF